MKTSDKLPTEFPAACNASLRIAIVTETFAPEVNGVAMTLGRIVQGLLHRGHTVQLVRPRQQRESAEQRQGLEEVLSLGIPVPTYGELRFGLPSRGRLTKLWSERRPDIVHVVTEGPLGWSAVAAARTLRLPLTSSFHTNFQSYTQHYGLGLLKSLIENYLRKLHNRTQATMVPTQAMVQELTGRGYDNATVVSRGVAIELFKPERRSWTLRESWGALPNDPVVILVGRLAKEKNLGVLVSAYRAIQAHNPRVKLVFVGDGPLRKSLQEACPEAIFAGIRKQEELAMYYASGDLFLFPSMTETFGNVVPEALASGLAVLSYANAAALELIVPEYNGVLVPNGDAEAFVNASVALALDPHKQQQIRLSAPASVAALAWGAVCDRFAAVLRDAQMQHGRQSAADDAPTLSVPGVSGPPAQERLTHSQLSPLR
ncbi:MAG: glycosyltransferase family 1 protein [Rhodoferax sp.]|nr:glycosyltransferase family 1 protein [Rhodoferax sp.]